MITSSSSSVATACPLTPASTRLELEAAVVLRTRAESQILSLTTAESLIGPAGGLLNFVRGEISRKSEFCRSASIFEWAIGLIESTELMEGINLGAGKRVGAATAIIGDNDLNAAAQKVRGHRRRQTQGEAPPCIRGPSAGGVKSQCVVQRSGNRAMVGTVTVKRDDDDCGRQDCRAGHTFVDKSTECFTLLAECLER
ncbi:hypothetical protein BDY19DRAFT_278131 [Irpex rosettiformis]|uniref:Uncharacterized protein n=1 Tax=Irpex rosettiformis TaxID=378272 RepID=A0ACB8UHV1_9APHY|nr:hypothetical protein BDY19DRAFT_278131 [Irpex rosettiformis]